jgi:hypothetical protein
MSKPTNSKTNFNPEQVFDSPFALGNAIGESGPFPYKLRMPVNDLDPDDYPVATFWVYPWNLDVSEAIAKTGANPDPAIKDHGAIARQNRVSAPLIIDKRKGWSNLFRADGTEFKYQPCSKDDEGTEKDPRVQLAKAGGLFGLVKGHTIMLAVEFRAVIEGNFASSSAKPTGDEDGQKQEQEPLPDA